MKRRANRARRTYRAEPLEPRRMLAIDIDPSFGDAGIARIDTGVDGFHGTVMVRELADGKILTVTGVGFAQAQGGTDVNAAVARFNADGLPDTTFGGGDGVVLIPIGDFLGDAVLHPQGSVYIVGHRADRVVVARVTSGGALDTTYGGGDGIAEVVVESAANETFTAHGLAVLFDGTVTTVGSMRVGDDDGHLVLARLTPQGTADATFDGDGVLVVNRPGFVDYAQVDVDSFDRVLVAMRADDRAVVGRFNDAHVDSTFGDQGFATFAQSRPGGDFPFSLEVHSATGGVIVGAQGFVGWLDASGNPNAHFSGDGVASLPTGSAAGDLVMEIALDNANRVVGVVDRAAFRLLDDGSPDLTFGAGGVVEVEDVTLTAVTVSPDNDDRLFVGGGETLANTNVTAARIAQHEGAVLGPTGVLVVTGTEGNDSITINLSGGQARLDLNGAVTTYPLADVSGAFVDGETGDNTITIAIDVDATVRAGAGNDTIVTAGGDDDVKSGDGANNVSTGMGTDVITTGDDGDTIVTGAGNDSVNANAGDDSIITGDGDDFIDASVGDNTVISNGGVDHVFSRDGADSIDAGAGDDRVLAGSGHNTLAGGDGDDFLEARDGHDSLTGGAGTDTLLGGEGNNALFGGTGNDLLKTGTGADTLWGEIGNDTLRAGTGDDYLNGGASKDKLFGQQGNDILYGGRNNDALDGGPGGDLLKGLDGNDKLFDRDGNADSLDGGAGIDVGLFDEDPLDTVLRVETVL